MRVFVAVAFTVVLSGCLGQNPGDSDKDDDPDDAAGHSVTFLGRDYNLAPGRSATYTVDVPAGASSVMFGLSRTGDERTGSNTLDLSGCGSKEVDWTDSRDLVEDPAGAILVSALCEPNATGPQDFVLTAPVAMADSIELRAMVPGDG